MQLKFHILKEKKKNRTQKKKKEKKIHQKLFFLDSVQRFLVFGYCISLVQFQLQSQLWLKKSLREYAGPISAMIYFQFPKKKKINKIEKEVNREETY